MNILQVIGWLCTLSMMWFAMDHFIEMHHVGWGILLTLGIWLGTIGDRWALQEITRKPEKPKKNES